MICVEIFLQNESKTVIKLSDILWSNLRKKILRVDVVFGCTVSERVRARWAHCACALSTRSREDRRSVCEVAQPCWDRALGPVCFTSVQYPRRKARPQTALQTKILNSRSLFSLVERTNSNIGWKLRAGALLQPDSTLFL